MGKIRYTLVRVNIIPVSDEPNAEQVGFLQLADNEYAASVQSRRTAGQDAYLEVVVAEELEEIVAEPVDEEQ